MIGVRQPGRFFGGTDTAACAVYQPLDKAVGSQTIRAMKAAARHLARSPQPGQARAAIRIDSHASNCVMRSRANGNQVSGNIEIKFMAGAGDTGKTHVDMVGIQMA